MEHLVFVRCDFVHVTAAVFLRLVGCDVKAIPSDVAILSMSKGPFQRLAAVMGLVFSQILTSCRRLQTHNKA